MPGKIDSQFKVIENQSTPFDENISIEKWRDWSIQVNYGAGGSGDMKLHASNDGENFSEIPASAQTMDGAGGTHVWEYRGSAFRYVKVEVPGTAVGSSIILVGVKEWA